ncbi:probable rRNA-processing protein EBP2 [Haliotis rufescens]|uniref:probable rRNA-processing protein EBP2 n=1 Tax=Haliotis rufescens TaxID=6454 RepID=UPI00201F0F2F|nr:probable rRNA-processing protein EBP2 [Haliotis rufescens]
MSDSDSSDYESMDTDEELQAAFASGKLKPGLNVVAEEPKTFFNDTEGMEVKLKAFQQNLDWIERLDLTNEPAPPPPGTDFDGEDDVNDDFRREMKFYCQAQASVVRGMAKLHHLEVPTKRPEDYFAQMAKSDDHMKKVREKLLEKQIGMERSEKAKKMRDLRKYGKKVQTEVLLQRQKEKREMLQSVKKYRKGQLNKLDFLDDVEKAEGKRNQPTVQNLDKKRNQPNKKRQFKNTKFGFGGQKKRSKYNTKDSAADVSEFAGAKQSGKYGKNPKKSGRPGKSKRMKMKNRKR